LPEFPDNGFVRGRDRSAMRPRTLILIAAALLAVPAAFALAPDAKVPEGAGSIQLLVRNELDAGFVRARITDADGREALDDLELLPKNGGWGVAAWMPPAVYHVELIRQTGVWPFAVRIVNEGEVDLRECPDATAIVRFETAFDGAEERVTGPIIECAG